MQIVRIVSVQVIHEGLKVGRAQAQKTAKVTRATEGIGRTIDPERTTRLLGTRHWLDPMERDPSAQDRTQTEAAFVHQPQAHLTRLLCNLGPQGTQRRGQLL
jgi:hypothetical protein